MPNVDDVYKEGGKQRRSVNQSVSQSVITTLLRTEHMVHYTLDLLECRGISGLITQTRETYRKPTPYLLSKYYSK